MGFVKLIALGIVIHIVLLAAVFDLYFTSPIIRGIAPVPNTVKPLAKRVVVISVDGLRTDALLENDAETDRPIAPYIRWIMSHRGAWSVSHTHLPTESRPGHVAMLAGFYEDPSAVTKGWKENPVDFDSIFNQTACSYSFGSPDIVNIFYKGLTHPCAHKWTYLENQDFSGNTMELDNWVSHKLKEVLSADPSVFTKSKNLFFLHLLGQDTSGHTHKPKTRRYRENLVNVDRIVREVDQLLGQDNETAFVLTADHGMTDWGSHGAGDPTETLTPLVAWGRGIKKSPGEPIYLEGVQQADITPLLAFLLGVSIPVNSIGTVPIKFLNYSNLQAAEALLVNAKQIDAQYQAKKQEIESKSYFLTYKEFTKLGKQLVETEVEYAVNEIKQGRPDNANIVSQRLIKLSLEGIQFYQQYFQGPLFLCTAAVFGLWALLLLLSINETDTKYKASKIRYLTLLVMAGISFVLAKESFPLMYHAYAQLPLFLIFILGSYRFSFSPTISLTKIIFTSALVLIGVELFVVAFFYRQALIVSLAFVISWPLLKRKTRENTRLIVVWAISGASLAAFLFVPVVGKQPEIIRNLLATFLITALAAVKTQSLILSLLVAVAGVNSYWVHTTFNTSGTVQAYNQNLSYALLAAACLIPILTRSVQNVFEKLDYSLIAISIPFLLLSVSHEGVFLLFLIVNLSCWIRLEMLAGDVVGGGVLYESYSRKQLHTTQLSIADFRRAYFFLTYIFVAFFGIGNLATLNSFDPAWVRCFLTTFFPFIMTSLILFKVVLPFLTVSLVLRVLTLLMNIAPYKIFIIVLVYCNIMGANFLFFVKTEGSWLDIGTSLSHYVIQQVAIVFLLILHLVSQLLIPARGKLSRTVIADETLWTIEDGFLCIVLVNANFSVGEQMWESLLADGSYPADPLTAHEMRKNLDLEKFQLENPGFDFSNAKLSKNYDKPPGWSKDRLEELKERSGQDEET